MRFDVAGAGRGLAVLAVLAGCGPQEPGAREVAEVTFVYRAPTARDLSVPDCGAGETHIHPSWLSYDAYFFEAQGPDEWRYTFRTVPVGSRNRIRVNDPNECARDANGATIRNIFANGVLLTSQVPTPGNGTEPGLSFMVAEDGTVTP